MDADKIDMSTKGATEMKSYKVFEQGLMVGEMVMSPARVRELLAKTGYVLIPAEGGR